MKVTKNEQEGTVTIHTNCPSCGKQNADITIGAQAFINWAHGGQYIQSAMPMLTPSQREHILTGLCDDCFPSDEDDGQENVTGLEEVATLQPPNPDEFEMPPYSMICASAVAEAGKYTMVIGKSGRRWFYEDRPDGGDSVYVTAHANPDVRGEGFGGRTISLPLVDGSTFHLKGGWHTTPNSMFADTGVDIRNRHRTFVVLGTGWRSSDTNSSNRAIMTGVVYRDPDGGLIGAFNRYEELAKQFPKATVYYSQSSGGSSSGPINQR